MTAENAKCAENQANSTFLHGVENVAAEGGKLVFVLTSASGGIVGLESPVFRLEPHGQRKTLVEDASDTSEPEPRGDCLRPINERPREAHAALGAAFNEAPFHNPGKGLLAGLIEQNHSVFQGHLSA